MSQLKTIAISGVKWSATSNVSAQAVQFATTIVLARLLTPADFGLVGIAMVVIGFISIFKDLGTSAAIIQKESVSSRFLSSIFWVNTGFGVFATIIVFFGAPLGGIFFHNPEINPILKLLSFNFIISSLSILQQSLLKRDMAFKVLSKIEIASIVLGAGIGIVMAFSGFGVWSLVVQSLATSTTSSILLCLNGKFRPQLIFNWADVRSVSQFSGNLVGFNVFNHFARNMDNLLIGRYLGPSPLGIYSIAYRLLLFPVRNISGLINNVMFPIYSRIYDDNPRISNAYLNVAKMIAFITFPLMLGLTVLAEPFVLTVFGSQWASSIILVTIFAPIGLIQSIGTTVGSIYQAKGRTDLMLYMGILGGTTFIASIIIGLQWGLIGVTLSYAVAAIILWYPALAVPLRLIDLKFSDLLKVLLIPFLNGILMALLTFSLRILLENWYNNKVTLIICVTFGASLYLLANYVNNRSQLKQIAELVGFTVNSQGNTTKC